MTQHVAGRRGKARSGVPGRELPRMVSSPVPVTDDETTRSQPQ
jgi:hypothetical protein